ncbi:RND transporter [Thermosipho melanesiensis]|uniref:Exporter of the RND superfamily-like protein n=2 Tax=Thermosipho melanesiensis TaxID=46541 RepID=A6LN66_THEM4|nr:MMPL family transporter [Thermosipho melanesiensis]ABR31367.1 exporter of the RND superfamily-like protein [Thermosipho melanesiensis BI429]APT74427.1 RND transporter [Thermosipho melanesiensis]OOC36389.1 RND transporter [Thermosipho melanesiensis]OOC37207.1 RND transporter [Thermosipho melanesiensis]OOC37959.1 RND transporter [Thermosipho melanesiensis]
MKKIILFSIILFVSILLIFFKGKIYTGPEVFLPGFKYNQKIENIENSNIKNFIKLGKDFNDGNTIFLILYSENTFFNKPLTEKLINLVKELKKDYISTIISPVNIPKIGFSRETYIKDNILQKDILRDNSAKNFLSKDGKYCIVNLTFKPETNSRAYISQIENIVKKYFSKYYLFGEPVIDSYLFKELIKQMYIYPSFMFILILLFFYYQTKSLRTSFFILLAPVISSIITISLLFITGRPLNTLTVMIFSFLLIIGSGYGLHYYNSFYKNKDFSKTKKHILIPILLSMLTTAAGFLSFLFVKIEAFRELGVLVSIGLAINVVIIFELSPLILKLEKNPPERFGIKYLGDNFAKISLTIFIIILIFSPFIIKNISIKSDMLSYFSKNSELGKATEIMENIFNFREPISLVIEKDTAFLATDNKKLENFSKKLKESKFVSNVNFPFEIPIPILYNFSKTEPILKYYISGKEKIRLIIYLTKEGYSNMDFVLTLIKKYIPYKNFYVAGSALIWNDINKSILSTQIKSIISASIIIFFMVLIIFRSLKTSISIIIPISFTTIFNFIFMSLLKINLDISTSITSSILMGLVIDYSIHIANDERITKSSNQTVINVGPPILTNGLGLILGFLVLLFSPLKLFKSISLLIIFGISIGLFFTLVIQPFLLKITFKK